MVKHTYIHIPFCKKICSYCDFCKLFYDKKQVSLYIKSLKKEINNIYKGEEQDTIYIGGGTPSSLDLEELKELFKVLNILKKSKDIEYTIECNFSTITYEKLCLFKEYGINRLSFGIESVNPKNLEILDRQENKNTIIKVLDMARNLGFNNINLDLMYAIPKESISDLEKDIDFILRLNPEHISTYSLIIEEHTKLYLNNTKKISEDLDLLMYNRICKRLKSNYNHYEISNFAKEGYESKHNTCYWKNKEYYGFGLGASSYLNDIRYTNTRSITKYLDNEYTYTKEILSKEDKMEYEMILGLRLLSGVSKEEFYNKYKVYINEYFDIDKLLDNKLLEESETNYYINEENLYISNEILLNFIKE